MGQQGFLVPENSRWIRRNCIGKGSFGSVSLAINRSDGRIFAVKSVEKASSLPAQLDALENEITILRSLYSPFIVKYYGDDVTEDPSSAAVYRNLHMEYLPGGTVSAVTVDGDELMDEELVRAYTWCVVSALKYIHSKGIVHCDVKGRNILVGPTPGIAKLADFGSARRVGSSMSSMVGSNLTSKIVPRGSPLWMAPEVVRGESQGFESDMWSLGCTVIEMVTGKPAWRDDGVNTLSRIGYSDELPQLPSQLSELGLDFLEKCLRRDPSQRWSCDQLLQHPYLLFSSASKIAESSPRSVIDWSSLEDHDDYSEDEEEVKLASCGERDIPATAETADVAERMGKLATTRGVNWESDGWMVVRSSCSEVHGDGRATSDACCSGSGVWTSWEYLDSSPGEEGKRGANLANHSSTWTNSRIDENGGDCGGWVGGSSCHFYELGLEKKHSAVGLRKEKKLSAVTETVELLLLLILLRLYSKNLRHNNNNRQLLVCYIFYFILLFRLHLFLFNGYMVKNILRKI
ncbi:hypothetical protein Ancab_007423 [Ancistrocladus abbreviatus]